MKHILTIIAALLLSCMFPLYAEELEGESKAYDPKGAWWLNLGLGAGTTSSHDTSSSAGSGMSLGISLNYALSERNFIEIRATETGDGDWSSSYNNEKLGDVLDIGLLYGVMKKSRHTMVGASIGLAYTQVDFSTAYLVTTNNNWTTKYKVRHVYTVGVPFEVQFFLKPIPYVGIGLIGLANLNLEAPAFGALLGIQIGNK